MGRGALSDLTDSIFFHLFPQQRSEPIFEQPIGQVWYAMALDQLADMQSGKTLFTMTFSEGSYRDEARGLLAPGRGHVHIMELSQGQLLRLNLRAPRGQTRLSLYPPRPTAEQPALLERSRQLTWSGRVPQSGYYEVVITSTVDETIAYELTVSADVVSRPAPAPSNAPGADADGATQADPDEPEDNPTDRAPTPPPDSPEGDRPNAPSSETESAPQEPSGTPDSPAVPAPPTDGDASEAPRGSADILEEVPQAEPETGE